MIALGLDILKALRTENKKPKLTNSIKLDLMFEKDERQLFQKINTILHKFTFLKLNHIKYYRYRIH